MKRKVLWCGLSLLLVVALVLASCGDVAPGEQEEEEEEVMPAVGEQKEEEEEEELPIGEQEEEEEEPPVGEQEQEEEEPTVTAYSLSITISPSDAGSVSPLDGQHEEGTRVTLTATPASGYTFDYWSGDASGTSPTITITMDSDKSAIAHFTDITPPVISGVDIFHITESSTTINWATEEPATSQVKYGTSDAYGSTTPLDDSLNTSHSVILTQLKPKTTYHFRIRSVDEVGNEALSEDYTFMTKTTKELLSATLYPAITIGSRVHELGFNLFNGSSQMITVSRAEFSDKNDNITHTISASDIKRIWQTGDIKTGESFSGSISFGIAPTTEEIEDWQVKWYCLDANGVEFTVIGASHESS